ncbi:hypothetical protein TWF694_009789 [Orbilia ellipsospora]|uniref:Uncharacterized protein n=1 Tax=Orbilia ellipsospora TaxID=2528407 RepID=A0AAV9XEL8_9PEZI
MSYYQNGPSDSYATSQFYGGGAPPPVPPRPNSGYMNQPPYPNQQQQPPYPSGSPYPQYQTPPPTSYGNQGGYSGGYPSPQPPPFGGPQHTPSFYGASPSPQPPYPTHSPQPPTGYNMPPPQAPYQSSASQWGTAPAPVHSNLPPQYPSGPGSVQYPQPGQLPTFSTNQWTRNQSGPKPPPSSMQTYNPGGQHPGGGLRYQHSTCQGKRKALLIGIVSNTC